MSTLRRSRFETDRDDFRLANLPTDTAGQPMTISFTNPEILAGRWDQLGPETDIYSMGVMLYELLSHRLPFADKNGKLPDRNTLVELIKTTPPSPVRQLNRRVSRDLAAITAKAMARDISNRYRSMDELAEDIRAALEIRPVLARKPTMLLGIQKLAQRNASRFVRLRDSCGHRRLDFHLACSQSSAGRGPSGDGCAKCGTSCPKRPLARRSSLFGQCGGGGGRR